jgi:hypothetical protein
MPSAMAIAPNVLPSIGVFARGNFSGPGVLIVIIEPFSAFIGD